MAKSRSNRVLATPSSYAKNHYLFVQEIGTLQSLEPHISARKNLDSFLFFIVMSGKGSVTYNNTTYFLGSGDCVWINCKNQYAHESSEDNPWSLMWVHFSGKMAESYYQNYLEQGNPTRFKPGNLTPYTDCLNNLYLLHKDQDFLMELSSNKYITDLITLCYLEHRQDPDKEHSISEKLQQIRKYIELHFSEKISLNLLSEKFYISKYHLAREYKKQFGNTIVGDLTAKRISGSKSLLRFSAYPVEQIGIMCGFQDAGYFIKVFKLSEGLTPLAYRKKW